LLTALVMAVPVSATAEPIGATSLGNVFTSLPPSLKERVRYDGTRLWLRGPLSAADRQAFDATLDAEYQDRIRALDERLNPLHGEHALH